MNKSETSCMPNDSLTKGWRIRVNGNGRYIVEKQCWFFWFKLKDGYFFSKEDACKAIREYEQHKLDTKKWKAAQKQWRDAGPC